MKPERFAVWTSIKTARLRLGGAQVKDVTTCDEAALKARDKLWVWRSSSETTIAPKKPLEIREVPAASELQRIYFPPHYRGSALPIMRSGSIDRVWARNPCVKVWCAQAANGGIAAFDAATIPSHKTIKLRSIKQRK